MSLIPSGELKGLKGRHFVACCFSINESNSLRGVESPGCIRGRNRGYLRVSMSLIPSGELKAADQAVYQVIDIRCINESNSLRGVESGSTAILPALPAQSGINESNSLRGVERIMSPRLTLSPTFVSMSLIPSGELKV